jgi:acetolactate synthase small subunit
MIVMSSPMPLAAPPQPEGGASTVTACYRVHARAEPGVMPRILELFAKRGLVPRKWRSTASPEALAIEVQIVGLDRDVAAYIGRAMRQIAGVESVLSSEIRAAP